jgi:hypothetical protein
LRGLLPRIRREYKPLLPFSYPWPTVASCMERSANRGCRGPRPLRQGQRPPRRPDRGEMTAADRTPPVGYAPIGEIPATFRHSRAEFRPELAAAKKAGGHLRLVSCSLAPASDAITRMTQSATAGVCLSAGVSATAGWCAREARTTCQGSEVGPTRQAVSARTSDPDQRSRGALCREPDAYANGLSSAIPVKAPCC